MNRAPAPDDQEQRTEATLFAEHWSKFAGRLANQNERLIGELGGCVGDVLGILESQLGRQVESPPADPARHSLQAYRRARSEVSRALLEEPDAEMRRRQPYRRALMAVEAYQRGIGDLVGSLPEAVPIRGSAASATIGSLVQSGWSRWLARRRHKDHPLPLKALADACIARQSLSRSEIEGEYFQSLLRMLRQVREPWDLTRAALDDTLLGGPVSHLDARERVERAGPELQLLAQRCNIRLETWRGWSAEAVASLARRILAYTVWRRRPRPPRNSGKPAANLAYWTGQSRLWETESRLELSLQRYEDRLLDLFQRTLHGVGAELCALLGELDRVIDWLGRKLAGNAPEDFPPPKADIIPALSRLAELEASLTIEIDQIPQSSDVPARLPASARRRVRARTIFPRETLHQAFLRSGRGETSRVLEEVEAEHRKILQEIERAREVVAFASETSELEGSDPKVVQESLQNAISLLEFYRTECPDWNVSADPRLARILASIFVAGRIMLRRRRLGASAYLAEQGLRRALVLAGSIAAAALGRLLRRSNQALEKLLSTILVGIGWRSAPTGGRVDVVVRPLLPQEFTVDLGAKDLPMLYRRLFRFEPLQDPRFLVGREDELAAITSARSLWEAGRPVSVLIVGERGSGKTSLINCALKRAFADLEVIRGDFKQRLLSAAEMRNFLAALLGAEDPSSLEELLNSRRHVIVLEELERTFLRQVGYYGAVRELQRIIAATCSTTLWIVATNQLAFKFLDAALALDQSFSYRINAGTATPEDLRRAILLRHNLSGLRLKFSAGRESVGRFRRLIRSQRIQGNAEEAFFSFLSAESAGIYRSAFEIWLGQIETAQSGVLYMKPLVQTDLTAVVRDLALEDLFTLVAILQHGLLTPEQHATIFQKSRAASRAQLDELLAREIVDRDPVGSGIRVRPEAMRLVKEALYRQNLI